MYSFGSSTASISASVMPKAGSAARRESRSQGSPSFIRAVAAMEQVRMISWSACRSPPRLTPSIIRFSVAMKGRYSRQVRSTIFSLTWSPSVTF